MEKQDLAIRKKTTLQHGNLVKAMFFLDYEI